MKLVQQEKARELRKQGMSIKEISRYLGVAKSSASLWVRSVPLSLKAKNILQAKHTAGQVRAAAVLHERTAKRLLVAKEFAKEVLKDFTKTSSVHKVCCALIYWCEGSKTIADRELKFTNSDPILMATFLELLRNSFSINETKFRVCVHLHDYHDEKVQLQFWSKTTKIPLSQFMKSYKKLHTGKQRKENYQGCVQISYNDVIVARQVQAVARMFGEEYMGL